VVERLAALDSDTLLAWEAGALVCVQACGLLRDGGFLFRVTPTTIQDLEKIQEDYSKEFARALAQNLLAPGALRDRRIVRASLSDAERDITEIHTATLLSKGLLQGAEEADVSSLIEAAYSDCDLFVTMNRGMLDAAHPLTLALMQICGMRTMYIVSPQEIVAAWSAA
jgi:hypothetical protein